MTEPRTHYQVSLTSRQALGLFLGLLAALGLAYFLGVMTGLAGRDESASAEEAAQAASATPAPEAAEAVPVPVRGVEPGGTTAPSAEVTAAPAAGGEPESIQAFEDRPSTPPPAATTAIRPTGNGEGLWVQVFSLSSASEARDRSVSLASRGYPARVLESTSGRKLWRVRVGPYATRDQAEDVARRLKREEKAETWIVPPGQ